MQQNKRHYRPNPNTRRTPAGWDAVADWYNGWMGKGGSEHHQKIAVPEVLSLLDPVSGEYILDIGAGQGVLAPHIAKTGAKYIGVDVSPKLLTLAKKHHGQHGKFVVADAAQLHTHADLRIESFDAVVFLLSIQDMNPLDEVVKSAAKMMKSGGRMVILMTHPAFRVPRQSGWGFDEERKLQYRRVDRYLTPLPVPMKQHPNAESGVTISFHRPISEYVNTLADAGLLIERMDEIPGGETTLKPNRTRAERLADEEIPLFLALKARKYIV